MFISSPTIAFDRRPTLVRVAPALLAVALVGFGAVLALALVGELAAPIAAGTHDDFLAFYAAGRLVLEGHPAALYLPSAITAIERTIIPGPVGANGYMPFLNPPFAAVVVAPLAALPTELARVVWAGVGAATLAGAALSISWPLAGRERIVAALLIGLSFPAYHTLAEGQWSALLLLGGVAALAAARRGSWCLAGLALATFWLKPQLILLPLLALALSRRWTAVGWSLMGGAGLVLASLPFVGIGPYATYLGYLVEVGTSHFTGAGELAASVWAGNLASLDGLNGLLVSVLGQGSVVSVDILWGLLVAGLLTGWLLACRSQGPGFETQAARRMLAAGIGIVLLVDPHLYPQDCLLVFLLVPALCPAARNDYRWVLVRVALLAALVALPVHLFTVALIVLVIGLCASSAGIVRWPSATADLFVVGSDEAG